MASESELGIRVSDRDKLLEDRPSIAQPYIDFNELRDMINDREKQWTVNDIDAWTTHIDPDFRNQLESTIFRLNAYKDLIYQHELHRDLIPDRLWNLTSELEKLISNARTFSDAQLKARVLYSVSENLENWQGVPIDSVIKKLKELKIQQRSNRNDY